MSRALQLSRQFSQRAVMEAVLQRGPISRASIAKQTGLSKQTISEIMRHLEDAGWVVETGRTAGHVGRSAITYEVVPDAAFVAAIDLGGTKVCIGLSDLRGAIVGEAAELTSPVGGQSLIDQIARLCRATAAAAGVARERIRIAVAGVPGAPDPVTGRVRLAPNIPGFDQMDVATALEAALGCDVLLENDVNLAVQGEAWQGAGQGLDNLAFIALGTGIGSGLVVGGELVRGADNAAGELGFLPFGADPFEAESLHTGAYERLVASAGIRARYAVHAGGPEIEVPEVFARAAVGDLAAERVVDETARLLARGIAAIAAIANPQLVVLGGSIGSRPELIARVRVLLPACMPAPVAIAPSRLGPQAALIGAAAIGLGHLHNALFGADAPEARLSLPPPRLAGALT
jgi:predicted NBD/HSP70 family sugar kinase/biotin operon repressor